MVNIHCNYRHGRVANCGFQVSKFLHKKIIRPNYESRNLPNTFAVPNRNFMINFISSKSYSLEELSTAITTIILVVNPVLNAIRLRHAQLH